MTTRQIRFSKLRRTQKKNTKRQRVARVLFASIVIVNVMSSSLAHAQCSGVSAPMGVFREVNPGTEACDPTSLVAADELYFTPPAHLVTSGTWRLIDPIRDAVRRARRNNPLLLDVLAESAFHYYVAQYASSTITLSDAFTPAERIDLARALADVTVTGRGAWERFRGINPQESNLTPLVLFKIALRGVTPEAPELEDAVRFTLDRAYRVAYALRGPAATSSGHRKLLGWIAVSGEDDAPHRPVNVASASLTAGYSQHDLALRVQDLPVVTRFIAASSGGNCYSEEGFDPDFDPGFWIDFESEHEYLTDPGYDSLFDDDETLAQIDPEYLEEAKFNPEWLDELEVSGVLELVDNGERYFLPEEPAPCIPPENDIIIFIHGHTSRLEEAMDLIPHLHRESGYRGRDLTVLAMDLPMNGYASMFHHERIAPTENSVWHLSDEGATLGSGSYPALDFIEDFIVAFVDELDERHAIKDRIVAVIGGSLGGNMTLRLGQRGHAWAHTVVSWSPAATWGESWGGATTSPFEALFERYRYFDVGKAASRTVSWEFLNASGEGPNERDIYFYVVFDAPVIGQAGHWFRDGWQPCKDDYIRHSILDRREVYNRWFRLWHWRVAYEQLIYSHYDQVSRSDDTRRFERITSRTLLLAGEEDNSYEKLHDRVAEMAERMVNTPGCAYFLQNTGHSIHAERPAYLAFKIIDFVR